MHSSFKEKVTILCVLQEIVGDIVKVSVGEGEQDLTKQKRNQLVVNIKNTMSDRAATEKKGHTKVFSAQYISVM